MLGVSGLLRSSGDGAASATHAEGGGGGGLELGGGGLGGSNSGGFSEDEKAATRGEEGDRSSAGNRWPRQETLALLKIRSDMDAAFKDSSLKGPLWEEVSRKLAELGYQRSAKKCKEKFENVYKYHKRTKEGRASKPDAKTYRFFDQLEALDNHPIPNIPSLGPPPALPVPALPPPLQQQPKSQTPAASAVAPPPPLMLPAATSPQPLPLQQITVPSATANKQPTANNSASQNTSASTPTAMSISPSSINPSPLPPQAAPQQPRNPTNIPQAPSMMNPSSQAHSFRHLQLSNSTSSSSSTSSDETLDGMEGGSGGGRKRKRKWKDFFERLMRDVIKKQEELQKRFLEAIEKRERDRIAREEAWRMQEMARMNREHEILVKERSIAAAKDAALIAFLQKMSSDPQNPVQVPPVPEDAAAVALQVVSPPPPPPQHQLPTQAQPQPSTQVQPQTPLAAVQQQQPPPQTPTNLGTIVRVNSNSMVAMMGGSLEGVNVTSPPSTSSSRWPKTEVQALIKLRTDLDVKYQESGPKGPLWEEISAGMRQLGYTRNAKRCKEKWENINKYFKKVKESNKKRPEDSKTCPYFHQLDALYREKTLMRTDGGSSNNPNPNYVPLLKAPASAVGSSGQTTVASILPMMVRPEQQWPLHPEDQRPPPEDIGSENMEPNPDDDMDDDVDDGDDDDEDDEGGGYEIVTNKQKAASGES